MRRFAPIALVIALAVPAQAAASPLSAGSSALSSDDPGHEFFRELFTAPGSSQSSLDASLSALSLVGSSEIPIFDMIQEDPGIPLPVSEDITTPEIVSKTVESGQFERWVIASPSMKREVQVQLRKANDPAAPAPMLYLLDGVDGPTTSEWTTRTDLNATFARDNVTLVLPTQSHGSLYMDWQNEDPAVGRAKWETFLTQELPPLLEIDPELQFNGHRAIGGLSMGASAAVQIANLNPGLFDAAIGISGCYSTMDNLGHQMTHLTVATRGGDTKNMWGEFGSDAWRAHDVTLNPSGLANTKLYLSSGNGVVSADEYEYYLGVADSTNVFAGGVLETGVRACTERLDAALQGSGAQNFTVNYTPEGAHTWITFAKQIGPAWDYVKDVLY